MFLFLIPIVLLTLVVLIVSALLVVPILLIVSVVVVISVVPTNHFKFLEREMNSFVSRWILLNLNVLEFFQTFKLLGGGCQFGLGQFFRFLKFGDY